VFGLGRGEILFARKPTVKGDLEGIASIEITLTIKHLIGEARVSRVALTDDAIGDEVGCATGETNFMTTEGIAMILHNDVGVRFKEGDDLLGGGHRFPVDHPPLGLIDHPAGELGIGLERFSHLLCQEYLNRIRGEVAFEESLRPLGIGKSLPGDGEQIEVVFLSGLCILGIHDTHHPSLGPLRVIGEGDRKALHLLLGLGENSGEHPNRVPQKA